MKSTTDCDTIHMYISMAMHWVHLFQPQPIPPPFHYTPFAPLLYIQEDSVFVSFCHLDTYYEVLHNLMCIEDCCKYYSVATLKIKYFEVPSNSDCNRCTHSACNVCSYCMYFGGTCFVLVAYTYWYIRIYVRTLVTVVCTCVVKLGCLVSSQCELSQLGIVIVAGSWLDFMKWYSCHWMWVLTVWWNRRACM